MEKIINKFSWFIFLFEGASYKGSLLLFGQIRGHWSHLCHLGQAVPQGNGTGSRDHDFGMGELESFPPLLPSPRNRNGKFLKFLDHFRIFSVSISFFYDFSYKNDFINYFFIFIFYLLPCSGFVLRILEYFSNALDVDILSNFFPVELFSSF